MRCVVDASVALKWLFWGPDSGLARRLAEAGHEVHAPRFLAIELSNALWSKVDEGKIEPAQAIASATAIPLLGVQWEDDLPLCPAAVRLALELDDAAHDCFYFVLAERLGVRLVTEDQRFLRALKKIGRDGLAVRLRDIEKELGSPSAPH